MSELGVNLLLGAFWLLVFLYAINCAAWYAVHERIPVKSTLCIAVAAIIFGAIVQLDADLPFLRFALGYFSILTLSYCSLRCLAASRDVSEPSECDTPAIISARDEMHQEWLITSHPVARTATRLLALTAALLLLAVILI